MQQKPTDSADSLDIGSRLALAYAPAEAREAWAALLMFEQRMSETARPGREPLMIQLRLAWWRDRLKEPCSAWPVSEPVLDRLRAWNGRHGKLVGLVNGWEAHAVSEDGGGELAKARVAALVSLAELLGVSDVAAVRIAAEEMIAPGSAGSVRPRLPRAMRPLGVLVVLAQRDARNGAPRPLRDMGRVLRAGLLGRY